MNEVIAHIDISTPTGKRIVNQLQKHRKTVKMEYPLPDEITGQELYTVEEAFAGLEKRIKEHYANG